MSKQPTASAKPAPQLATPTDLGDNARADIAAVINTLLADTFALYLIPRLSYTTSILRSAVSPPRGRGCL
jgi:hypothetical protein